jgi:hypothetical protein
LSKPRKPLLRPDAALFPELVFFASSEAKYFTLGRMPNVCSHLRIECGRCVTTVPVHACEDIGPGLLRRIERDVEPCLGKGWLKKS